MLEKYERYFSLSKNIALTIGIPVVLYMTTHLHQAEVNSLQAEISTMRSQVETMQLLSYDKLPAILEGKDIAEKERRDRLIQRIKMLGGEFDFNDINSRYLCLKLNSKASN
jgi:hypothetical protein